MRLLLRASSHQRTAAGALQLAASPDTRNREAWQWDLHLTEQQAAQDATVSARLARGEGSASVLAVNADPAAVVPSIELLDLSDELRVERDPGELVILVVGCGAVLVEGRHVLGELDTLVLAGDDPTEVDVRQASAEPPSAALVRLRPAGTGALAWVP